MLVRAGSLRRSLPSKSWIFSSLDMHCIAQFTNGRFVDCYQTAVLTVVNVLNVGIVYNVYLRIKQTV